MYDNQNSKFVSEVAERYVYLLISMVFGVTFTIHMLPIAVLSNVAFHFMLGLITIAAGVVYSIKSDKSIGIDEFITGGLFGSFFAFNILVFEALMPGSVLIAAYTTLSVVLGSVVFVLVDQEKAESVSSLGNLSIQWLSAILVGVFVLNVLAWASGLALLSLAVEMCCAGVFALCLVANINNVLRTKTVSVIGINGETTQVQPTNNRSGQFQNARGAAIRLFFNTLDLFMSLLRLMYYINESKKDKSKKQTVNFLKGCAFLFGCAYAVYYMAKGTFGKGALKSHDQPPSYESSTHRSQVPVYESSASGNESNDVPPAYSW